jgi:hypothetical protein
MTRAGSAGAWRWWKSFAARLRLNPSVARELGRLPVGNQEELLIAIRRDGLSTTEVRQVVDLLIGCTTREQREYVLLKPREAVRKVTGGLTRSYDPRLSVAENRLPRRLGRAFGRPGLDGELAAP